MNKYQVVFFGTSEFAVPTLDILSKSDDFAIKAVVTQPDRPSGRHQELEPTPVKKYAKTINIDILQPEKLKGNTDFIELLKDLEPDILVVVSYGSIIPREILDIPTHGAVNIHPSLLPKYRGASPIQHALLNGDTMTGVALMKVSEAMDAGDILLIKKLAIEPNDTYDTLHKKLALLGAAMTPLVLTDYINGDLKPIKQDESKVTICGKIEKDDGKINWTTMSAEKINNMIRALTPWPSCFTTWNGKRIKILSAAIDTEKNIEPGKMEIHESELWIGTTKGVVIPKELQIEGKSVSDCKSFLNGNRQKILSDSVLGS